MVEKVLAELEFDEVVELFPPVTVSGFWVVFSSVGMR